MINNALLSPYAIYESFIEMAKQCVLKFYASSPTLITQYIFNLYNLYGVSNTFDIQNNELQRTLIRPYCVFTLTEAPRVNEDRTNPNINNIRYLPALAMRNSPAYIGKRPFTPILVHSKDHRFTISRIDQYMECTCETAIWCDSFEMAYDYKRYTESMLVPNKKIAFRNLLVPYQLSIDQANMLPDYVRDKLQDVSIRRIVTQSGKHVYTIPVCTWCFITMSDSRVDIENVPFEGNEINYKYTTTWQLFYHEPTAYYYTSWT